MPNLLTPDQLFEMYLPIIETWESDGPAPPLLGWVTDDGVVAAGPIIGENPYPMEILENVDPQMMTPGATLDQMFFVNECRGTYNEFEYVPVVAYYAVSIHPGGTYRAVSPMTREILMNETGEVAVKIIWKKPGEQPPPLLYDDDEDDDPIIARMREIIVAGGNGFPPGALN